MNKTEEQKRKKFYLMGITCHIIGSVLSILLIMLLFKYKLRFIGPFPTFAFMFIPFIAGSWFYSFSAAETSKRKIAIFGNSISTILFLLATGLAMSFPLSVS